MKAVKPSLDERLKEHADARVAAALQELAEATAAHKDISAKNPFQPGTRLYQIYAAHQSARPSCANPAWQNTHMDLGYVLDELIRAMRRSRIFPAEKP